MAEIKIEQIKRLRELTGAGITDAKAALVESKGDFDKALGAMRKKGLTKAEKRGEREARSGVIGNYNHDNRIGVIVEVNCETDFVARNEIFMDLVKDVAMQIAASSPEYVSSNDFPKKVIEAKATEFREKAIAEGKPEKIIDKIVDGMVQKHFDELSLLSQPFIKNLEISVDQHIKEVMAKLGENIIIRRFSRMAVGEVN